MYDFVELIYFAVLICAFYVLSESNKLFKKKKIGPKSKKDKDNKI